MPEVISKEESKTVATEILAEKDEAKEIIEPPIITDKAAEVKEPL